MRKCVIVVAVFLLAANAATPTFAACTKTNVIRSPEATGPPAALGTNIDWLIYDNPDNSVAGLQGPTGVHVSTGHPVPLALAVVHSVDNEPEGYLTNSVESPVLVFHLNGPPPTGGFDINGIIIWNYDDPANGPLWGVKNLELIFHTTAEGPSFSFASAGGTEATEVTLTDFVGHGGSTATNTAQMRSFGCVEAAYVGMRITDNLSMAGDMWGLGEVRFTGDNGIVIPEPADLGLVAISLLAVRKKRRT